MNHPIENIMQSSMEHIKALADVNTVIGSPIMTDGGMILPVSKVALGMLVGGGEYIAASVPKKSAVEINCEGNYPFIGASTLGMSLTPLAFLSVQGDSVRVLPAKQDSTLDRLVDMLPQAMDAAERLIKELGGDCAPAPKTRRRHGRFASFEKRPEPEESAAPAGEKPEDRFRINIEYDGDEAE